MKKDELQKFKLIKSETGYQGRAFRVRKDTLKLPDGHAHIYDIIDHPGAVSIIPVDANGNILFIKQYRPATGVILLELPAGTLEKGEDPVVCAAREIQEETGFAARTFKPLGAVWLAPGYSSEYLHFFLATDLYPSTLAGDDDEYIAVEPVAYDRAIEMAYAGEIKDGKSLAGLLLLQNQMPQLKSNR